MKRPSHTPLLLLINDHEWTSRSIESILRPKGFGVLRAYTGQQALDLVAKTSPDLVIVDFHLPDFDGIEVSRRLRRAPTIRAYTPLLLLSSSTIGRAARLDALGAGVWDILRHPIDPGELILRLQNLVQAKQEADQVAEASLTDPETGFYNTRGLVRRAAELSADAGRFDRPIACVAVGREFLEAHAPRIDEPAGSDELENGLAEALVRAIRTTVRTCDSVGRLDKGEFVIVAPGTNRDGARRLADRILAELDRSGVIDPELTGRILAGFFAVDAPKKVPLGPEDLLSNATIALRRAQADAEGGFRIRSYEA